jgi:hypothetical protein
LHVRLSNGYEELGPSPFGGVGAGFAVEASNEMVDGIQGFRTHYLNLFSTEYRYKNVSHQLFTMSQASTKRQFIDMVHTQLL